QDLARSLVRTVAPGVEIVFTGLRPGEKLYEELSYDPELVAGTANDKIFVLRESEPASVTPEGIRALVAACAASASTDAEVVDALRAMGFAIR
ncbi:polysaccharide biosynthesis protein, partial [Schumannella luteola]